MRKISVIIPVFNISLDEFNTLKSSLMSQTINFEDMEIILVDNNSTYSFSKNFLKTFESYFENVKCVFLNNKYDSIYSLIFGFNLITTKYTIFYDYTENLTNDAFEILLNKIDKSNFDIVLGSYTNPDEKKYFEESSKEFLYTYPFLSSRIYKTDFIKNISFEDCESIAHLNYLTSSTTNIEILKKTLTKLNTITQKNFNTNIKKLNILKKIVNKEYSDLTIAIKTPNPTNEKQWGDYFFALSLKKSFQKIGFEVIVQEREFWYDSSGDIDIVIVLRGLIEYNPHPNHINLMWNISHPDDVSFEEYEKYDFVFIASKKYADKLNKKIDANIFPLFQCTDPEIFFNNKKKEFAEDILFVGITRGVFRQIIKDISQTKHDFSVYGKGWEKYIDKKFIKGSFIDNKILNQAYSSCKILLNDHWEDMVQNDFPSNRLFDALACGAFVISDDIPAAKELFEGNIVTYNSIDELDNKINYYLNNKKERESIARKGQKIVLENHTFDNRANEILNTLCNFDYTRFMCDLDLSIETLIDDNKRNVLRIIILDLNDSKYIEESLSSIKSLPYDISISIIKLPNFTQNKFNLNKYQKELIIENLNEIIKNCEENFILTIQSGDKINHDLTYLIEDIATGKYDAVSAIIFDDEKNINDETNYKLGFSPDLYLENDYIKYSAILNRNYLINNCSLDKTFQHNYIRNIILELYENGCPIMKKDIVGLKIKNDLEKTSLIENKELIEKFLKDKEYQLRINEDKNSIIPIYNPKNKKASIIIPFKDQVLLTKQCVNSILRKTNYQNFEIILVNNNSYKKETLEFLNEIKEHEKCKVIEYNAEFNWSKINNYASTKASGDVLVFLNNDTEIISKDWLSLLIGDAIQSNVGAVGSKLLYPDNSIQHAGVVIGLTYFAGHIFAKEHENNIPKIYNCHRRNVSAVTGACVAFKKETFIEIGKFDENYEISFSDVEICLRAIQYGYRNIYNPFSTLYHHEMKSRGTGDFRAIDRILAYNDFEYYLKIGDPFFNHNYSLNSTNLIKKSKNEMPKYKTFWNTFYNQKIAHEKSIINAMKKVSINENNEIFNNDLSKNDIIHNELLLKNYFRKPHLNFNNSLWLLPNLENIDQNELDTIFRFAELMSIFKNTNNYFVLDAPEIQIQNLEKKIKTKFNNLNYTLILNNKLINLEKMNFNIAICTDWISAYKLVKINNCIAKFYFIQPKKIVSIKKDFENNLIEQSYKFKFIGITNSKKIELEYSQFNKNIIYFNQSINKDIFFPYLEEKSNKMTILFHVEEKDKTAFNLGVEVLKILKEYFNNKIDIIIIGTDENLVEYNLKDIINLGKISSDIELANIYRRANICLMLAFDNVHPSKFLKCMACGCPIIINHNKKHDWILKQKENAILTEPNLHCIVEDIINLINDFKLRHRILDNGIKTIERIDEKEEFFKIIDFMENPKKIN